MMLMTSYYSPRPVPFLRVVQLLRVLKTTHILMLLVGFSNDQMKNREQGLHTKTAALMLGNI
jgi:hypothetical protein